MTCFAFVFVVRAEKEDFQGYFTEQTKGTTVTKDLLLKNENTTGHGTEAIPTEKTHQHTAMALTAKFPEAVLLDTRLTKPYKKSLITKASALISLPSSKHFVSRNGNSSLILKREPSAMRIDTESEKLLISNYEKISSSSAQSAIELMMNDTSDPEGNLTADAVKAPPWFHTLLDYRNQRNTNSVKLTSADGSLRPPVLYASHSRVIDNLDAARNDSSDKQSQGKDTTNPGRDLYGLGTVQSIFQNATAEDSPRGSTITNLCLTCLKDQKPSSTGKAALSTHGSPDNSKLTASLTSLYQQSARVQEEMLNRDVSHANLTKHSSFSEGGSLPYDQTFPSFSFSNTQSHTQSVLNDSPNLFFSSAPEAVAFHTRPLAEVSSETKEDTKKQLRHTYPSEASVKERPVSTSTTFSHSSKSFYIARKPVESGEKELYEKKVSTGVPQSDLIYFSKNNKTASHSVSTNLKSFIQRQSLDISSGPVSNMPVISSAPHSSHISVLTEGSDHSTASHPAVRMSSIEAHSAATPFSGSRPTALPVKNPESHFQTGRVDSLISLLRLQTPAKPSFQTKGPILTLLPKDSAIKLASATTKTHLTDKQDPLTFNAVHSIVKHSSVDPPGPMNKPVIREPQTTTTATTEVLPRKLFLSELSQDFGDDMPVLTLPTLSSKSLSEKLTISKFSGTQSKLIQVGTYDVARGKNVASTRQSYSTYSGDLIRESLRDNDTKSRDENEQVLYAVVENGNKTENDEEMNAIIKLQEGEKNRKDTTLNYQREKFKESREEEQEKIINTRAKTNQNVDREGEEMAAQTANMSREKGEMTNGEEGVTLRQNLDQSKGQISDEEGAERDSVTKIYKENFLKVAAEKQSESLKREEAEDRSEKTPEGKEDNKCVGETGKKDMTNVPFGPPTNSKEFNRDKEHVVENLSPCPSLIKQLETTENKGIHLGENATAIVEITNKSFTYKVTKNHRTTSQSPIQSKTTSLPKEPYTQTRSHLSLPKDVFPKHEVTSSLAKESARNEVVEATFGHHTLKFGDVLKPLVSPNSSAAKFTHPLLKTISNMLSLTTHRLTTAAGFPRAEPHFTVNSSTPNMSIIYDIPDQTHKFSASVSKANSILHTANESEQAEYIIASVNPGPHQKMYNHSSTRPPTATALSSEAHISIGQLQPRQAQPVPQISESSSSPSFDMTSGQPCSFKLSEQTAHPHALHTSVDGNEQRSVHTLTASSSPKAENDQFPHTNMSPLLNLSLFGGDILPGTYRLTGLTGSAVSPVLLNLLRANSNTQHVNGESDRVKSLLGTADETNQIKENDNARTMVTLKVKHLELVTEQISEMRLEKNSLPFITPMTGSNKDNIDELNSLSIMQADKPAMKMIHENDLISVNGENEANSTVTVPIKSVMLAVHAGPRTEPAMDDNFVYDFGTPAFSTHVAPSGTSPDVESEGWPEMPKIQHDDVTKMSVSDVKHHAEKTPGKQNNSVRNSALPAAHITFRNDIIILSKSTHQTDDQLITSSFQMITAVTDDSVSLAPTPTIGGVTVSKEDHESLLMASESVPVVENSSRAAAEHIEHSNRHTESLSLIGRPITPTTGKPTPAVKRQHTTETHSAELPEDKISVRTIEQSQHAAPAVFAITHNINDPEKDIQRDLLQTSHRAEGLHGPTSTMLRKMEYSLIKDIKTALTTKSAFEAKQSLLEKISAAYTQDRTEQPDRQTSHEKTSISQLISGFMADSAPTTRISPTDIINKSSCRTIGCARSTKTTETTTGPGEIDPSQKMYKTQGAVTERDHFRDEDTAGAKPENGNCSSDCLVAGKATPQAADLEYATLSAFISIGESDRGVDETMSEKARSVAAKAVHLERHWTPERPHFVRKTTQRRFHRETSKAQEVPAKEVTLSEPEAALLQTKIKATELTVLSEKNTKTQLNRGAGNVEVLEAQNATRLVSAAAKEESGRSLLLPESESELPKLKRRGRTSSHLYLSG